MVFQKLQKVVGWFFLKSRWSGGFLVGWFQNLENITDSDTTVSYPIALACCVIPNLLEWGVMFVMGELLTRFALPNHQVGHFSTCRTYKLGIVSNAFLGTQPH